jgi:hypothetical protein
MDYSFNEQGLEIFLQKKKCIIVTDKPINTELLKHYQSNIPQLMYIIDDNNDSNFVKELKKLGINYVLISYLNDNDLNKYKINYMDYNLIFQKTYNNKKQTNIQDVSNMFYISSKIIVSSQGQFNSKFDWLNKNGRKVVDDPEFWKESNSFYIFSLDQR